MNGVKVVVAVTLCGLICATAGVSRGAQVSDVYTGLRNMALEMKPDAVGVSPSASAHTPFGIVTDIPINDNYATVVANPDGHASIYLSTGGGYLGGEGNPKVSAAAKAAVKAANGALGQMTPAKEYPLPKPGTVTFYVLTISGVMGATSSESALHDTSTPLGRLYDAVQNVITQYRLIQK